MNSPTPILTGRTAVAGNVRGNVRILMTSEESHLVQSGDILVTPMTDPGMVPAMERAAAVVTDRGGITSHAANICREMRKPCIVGSKIATKVLKPNAQVDFIAKREGGAVYAI